MRSVSVVVTTSSLAPLLLLWACPGYDARVVTPESIKEVNKVAAATVRPVDVLFVVDNSGSMADEQENLAQNFGRFIQELSSDPKNDYRLAVITTDFDSPDAQERQGVVTPTWGPAPYYFSTGSDYQTACSPVADVKHGCFRGPDPALRIIDSTRLTPAQQVAAFQANVRVGSCGSGTERGLQAMLNGVSLGCNAGFMRPDANLVVVLVSDEEDQSEPGRDYVRDLLAASGKRADQVRVAAIVGSVDGRASLCNKSGASCGQSVCALPRPGDAEGGASWDTIPYACQWCSYFGGPDCCTAVPGSRYVTFAQALEDAARAADPSFADADCRATGDQRAACLVDSICQESFGDTLARIARELVSTRTYTLSPPTRYAPGVVVELNGTPLVNCATVAEGASCDFTVTPAGDALTLATAPREDQTVQIYFTVPE
jgi:Mg-chelatase subunit ChlD